MGGSAKTNRIVVRKKIVITNLPPIHDPECLLIH